MAGVISTWRPVNSNSICPPLQASSQSVFLKRLLQASSSNVFFKRLLQASSSSVLVAFESRCLRITLPSNHVAFESRCLRITGWIASSRVVGWLAGIPPVQGFFGRKPGPKRRRGTEQAWSHDRSTLPRTRYPHLFTVFGYGSAAQ